MTFWYYQNFSGEIGPRVCIDPISIDFDFRSKSPTNFDSRRPISIVFDAASKSPKIEPAVLPTVILRAGQMYYRTFQAKRLAVTNGTSSVDVR